MYALLHRLSKSQLPVQVGPTDADDARALAAYGWIQAVYPRGESMQIVAVTIAGMQALDFLTVAYEDGLVDFWGGLATSVLAEDPQPSAEPRRSSASGFLLP
ncbi:hypothetical protein [Aquabacterium humicola]|uniref:hypothetical protein n=1 Tax=Aquabacterium humicola TaxID=3237377 RepID=UPI002542C168|nr:hypothetical protein [Rubrivivax pictus]